jgi:hypothetical protein
MNRLLPDSFSGPRVYFTGFDHRIVSNVTNEEVFGKTIERRLKLLLLHKTTMVCAASHLKTEFAFRFFMKHPVLLNKSLIIPALRTDKNSIKDALEGNTFLNKNLSIKFFLDNVPNVASWELVDNSIWFRNHFLSELKEEKSLLRTNLKDIPPVKLDYLIHAIEEKEILERGLIDDVTSEFSEKNKRVLRNYRELLYHISGSRVVNCESSLPQENYIDYDFADLSANRTKLSDEEILYKLFMELVWDSFGKPLFPIENLDLLSFDEILEVRNNLIQNSVPNCYDQLTKTILNSYKKGNGLLNLNELEEIRERLEKKFKEAINVELLKQQGSKIRESRNKLVFNSTSMALGVASYFPLVSVYATTASLAIGVPSFTMSLSSYIQNKKSLKCIEDCVARRNSTIKRTLESIDYKDKSSLLEIANQLSAKICEKLYV